MKEIVVCLAECLVFSAILAATGSADIAFMPYTIDDDFGEPSGVYACGVNGDGNTDVFGACYSGSEIAWWRHEGGSPLFWTKQTIDNDSWGRRLCLC